MDAQFPIESQKVADELLGNGQFAPGYERTYWEGCNHGFAVRGDMVRIHSISLVRAYVFIQRDGRTTRRLRLGRKVREACVFMRLNTSNDPSTYRCFPRVGQVVPEISVGVANPEINGSKQAYWDGDVFVTSDEYILPQLLSSKY